MCADAHNHFRNCETAVLINERQHMQTPLKIGQRWRTRAGFVAQVHEHNDSRDIPASSHPFVIRCQPRGADSGFTHYCTVTADGRHFTLRHMKSSFDLLELIEDAPAAPTPVLEAFDALAGIGDVNSTERGSGARYNTGKVPYELIPLRMLAVSIGTFDGGISHVASNALMALGEFQERDPECSLNDIFEILGFDGWEECARVFDYGRRKYAEWNWAKGMKWSVPLACAARHLIAMINGEDIDPESGLPHRGHVFCNVVMLLVYMGTFVEGDDRPAAGMLRLVEAA